MSKPLSRAVLLAAGQGSRLGDLTRFQPKCLMPIQDEPLLVRTVRQLVERGFEEIVIVVGHMRPIVIEALDAWRDRVRFVVNTAYATDTNIGSLLRGLGHSDARTLVIEADIAFDNQAMDALAQSAAGDDSIWFTIGSFRTFKLGGILRADAEGRLTDLRYVRENGPEFSDYKKLLGAVHVGPAEMPRFHALLREAAARSTAQYYMMPWVEHLAELPARELDLAHCRTATFNTPEEYRRCLELFTLHPEEAHAR